MTKPSFAPSKLDFSAFRPRRCTKCQRMKSDKDFRDDESQCKKCMRKSKV